MTNIQAIKWLNGLKANEILSATQEALDMAIKALEEERPQGEWIFLKANEEQTDGYECSVCKATYHTKVPYFSEFIFCPNCGARMNNLAKEINERLINEYISKVECCDECFASVYCTVNRLRESRVPQDYCVKNIKRYFVDNANLIGSKEQKGGAE